MQASKALPSWDPASSRTRLQSRTSASTSRSTTARWQRRNVSFLSPPGSGISRGPGSRDGVAGLAAASMYRSTRSPPAAGEAMRTSWWVGPIPWTGSPSIQTCPSAPKPLRPPYPRCTIRAQSRPANSAGTVPVTWSQVVPQSGPQASPTAKGSKEPATAWGYGTGSPGRWFARISTGAVVGQRAGLTVPRRSSSIRSSRFSFATCSCSVMAMGEEYRVPEWISPGGYPRASCPGHGTGVSARWGGPRGRAPG